MVDTKQGQVRFDHIHHFGDCGLAEYNKPFAFGRADILVAKTLCQLLADGDQIIAGIQAFCNFYSLAQCLTIAQMR